MGEEASGRRSLCRHSRMLKLMEDRTGRTMEEQILEVTLIWAKGRNLQPKRQNHRSKMPSISDQLVSRSRICLLLKVSDHIDLKYKERSL